MREMLFECERDREDQAGLSRLLEWAEEIRERQAGNGVGKWRHWSLHSVARKINPFQKMSDLVSANAQGDFEPFRIRRFLTHGRVKARAGLFDVSEVKARNIRDRLNVIV